MEIKCLASGSTGNCYIVHQEGVKYILDAGVHIRKIISNVNLNEIDFAFISHEHKDHSESLVNLQTKGVGTIYGKYVEEFKKMALTGKNGANIEIYLFPIIHGQRKDAVKNAGIIVKTKNEALLYVTDFTLCRYTLKEFKLTHLMVECNYDDAKMKIATMNYKRKSQIERHMSYNGLETFIDKAIDLTSVEEIYLIHLSTEAELIDKNIIALKAKLKFKKRIGICEQFGGINFYG